jgi:leucyl-tRNA synthetase
MFIGPFDAAMAWNENSLMGVKRFLDRFERFVEANRSVPQPSSSKARAAVNRVGRQVAEDIAAFKFNTGLAKMMEALNALEDLNEPVHPAQLRDFIKVLSPYAPFLTQTLWEKLGLQGAVALTDWPVYDPGLEMDEGVEMAVQVNGRLRGTIHVPTGADENAVRAAAESVESVTRHLEGKQVVKVIVVPNRTVNYVVKG